MAHPDVEAEQDYLDLAEVHLAAMRERTAHAVGSLTELVRGGDTDAASAQSHLRSRLHALDERRAALCFGRIIEAGLRGEDWYIGRRHVEDAAANPIIVDWRAPVAAPFYRATAANALHLSVRRRFVVDDRALVDLFEEIFDDPDHPELAHGGGGVPDPLLAELSRSRAGQLRDIVATIQAEQDIIIRAPLDRAVIVQGGPGTGKTAVGLHRAAYLLYEHRADVLAGKRVLVVGPNRLFLRYIAEVLPSLGETAVSQHTVETLAGSSYRVRGEDSFEVATLKGDVRMAALLEAALADRVSVPTETVSVSTSHGIARFTSEELADLVGVVRSATSTWTAGREVVRRRLEAAALARFTNAATGEGPEEGAFLASLRSGAEFSKLVDRLWPTMSAPALVRRVFGSAAARKRAGAAVLQPGELASLARSSARKVSDELWTPADMALLDEAEALIAGVPATYLHVVVDEAQDLTAMALRMVARRAPGGSMTVLGDLAQATAAGASENWDDVAALLGVRDAQRATLEVGYRLPGEILDWAAGLLATAAPGVPPTRSVRHVGFGPVVCSVAEDSLLDAVVTEVSAALQRWGLIGVIAPPDLTEEVRARLSDAGLEVSRVDPANLDHAVSVLTPPAAKGLEFDATVVVEPTRIASPHGVASRAGLRLLYIALTRSVQELRIVTTGALPDALS